MGWTGMMGLTVERGEDAARLAGIVEEVTCVMSALSATMAIDRERYIFSERGKGFPKT